MADLIETGMEPEFVITDIVRTEPVGNYLRLYLACQKHDRAVVQFTVLASVEDFAKMARQVLGLASKSDWMIEMKAH